MGRIGKLISFVKSSINSVSVNEAKSDLGGGEVVSSETFYPAGIDSAPLANDYALHVPIPQSGRYGASGFIDSANAPVAEAGEIRTYARGSDGASVNEVHLKSDGSIILKNESSNIEISSSGDITVTASGSASIEGSDITITDGTGTVAISGGTIDLNGVTIDPSGMMMGTIAQFTALTASSVTTGGLAFSGGGGVTGNLEITGGDVSANGVSLSTHIHTDAEGRPTSTPT